MLVRNNHPANIVYGGKYLIGLGVTEQPDELLSDETLQTLVTKAFWKPGAGGERALLEVVKGPAPTGGKSSSSASSNSLTDMTATEAIGVIQDTVDDSLLERWASEEQANPKKRKTVVDAINAQLEKLAFKDQEAADEEEDDRT